MSDLLMCKFTFFIVSPKVFILTKPYLEET